MIRAVCLGLAVAAGLPGALSAQDNVMGPCVDGFRWVATAIGPAPVAAYAACNPQRPFVTVSCSAGGLFMRIDDDFAELEPGALFLDSLAVDDTEFPVRMRAGLSEVQGLKFVEFRLDDRIVQALAAGLGAEVRVGNARPRLHLAASSDALNVLSRNC